MSLIRLVAPLFVAVLLGIAGFLQPLPSPRSNLSLRGSKVALRSPFTLPQTPPAETENLLSQLPLYFIENQGQIGSGARYYIQGRDRTLYFSPSGVIFRLAGPPTHIVTLQFSGADPDVQPEGFDRAEMTVSYFVGPAERWHTGLSAYAGVLYRDLWPGIDLIWRGESGRLKQLFRVRPGADPGRIGLIYRGALAVAVEPDGSLAVTTPAGSFRDSRPYAWQEAYGAAAEVAAAYRVTASEEGAWSYGFDVGAYNPALPLLLDPELFLYAGYVGGDMDDEATAVAVDAAGNTYVTGATASAEASFPDGDGFGALAGPDRTFNGNQDAFIAKVRPDGRGLVYVGYIGGSNSEYGHGVAVDAAGNAYVTGETASDAASFPGGSGFGALPGPDHTYNGGYADAFIVKVKANGTGLVYAGYIGGGSSDAGLAIAVDAQGNAYVAGMTGSDQTTFPDGGGFGALPGPDRTHNGDWDAFVVKVSADGTSLAYGGYIGGPQRDEGDGIAVDAAGRAYIMGKTESTHTTFPDGDGIGALTSFDATYNGGVSDAFVVRVKADGTSLEYAGFIGGNDMETYGQIALDAQGNAYITGATWSGQATFPDGNGFGALPGPDRTFNGNSDAFVAKVKSDGQALLYAGYIGGRWYDYGFGIAVDAAGNAYVTGNTGSSEDTFPDGDGFGALSGPDRTFNGGNDAYVVQVKPDGSGLGWGTYIGGDDDEDGAAVAVDAAGNVRVVGATESGGTSFPDGDGLGALPGPDRTLNGSRDAFVVAIGSGLPRQSLYLPLILR
jgi:hypothetical protein